MTCNEAKTKQRNLLFLSSLISQSDCIRRNQLDLGGATTLTNVDPEALVIRNLPTPNSSAKREKNNPKFAIAPGEGKIPTNLTQDKNWVENAFPQLFPTGRFGLNQERDTPLSAQQYFCQKFQNVDKRFCRFPPLVFAALYHIEKKSLESAVGISFRRGKVAGGKLTNIEDPCSVFKNQPGSMAYWKDKRNEILAKLDQFGPFHFFFTLSCADKRWDENFVAMLQQRGLKISYEPVPQEPQDKDGKGPDGKWSYKKDNIFVHQDGGKKVPLREFLEKEDLHEMVRQNVLTITMIFDKRVHSFMSNILRAPSSPLKMKYYHYRVEFQIRGAGHIHGVLWVDIPEIEKRSEGELNGLQAAMSKLKDVKNPKPLEPKDKEVLAKFVDKFVTCSLKDENLSKIVQEVQKHSHRGNVEKKTGCFKKGPTCRFNFPRLPSERTIIATPLKKEEGISEEAFTAKKKKLRKIIEDVKKELINLTEEEQDNMNIDDILRRVNVKKKEYYEALSISQTGACIILKRQLNEIYINNYNPEWIKAWDGNMDISVCLDFFAIVTYITDYYTKSETSMMKHITAAAKVCKARGDDLKTQLHHLTETFLRCREMGEMEAWYRIIPSLHLSESNVKTLFVATGFPENRSRLVLPVKDKMSITGDEGDGEDVPQKGTIEVEGSDKKYIKVTEIHGKYAKRPKQLENICLAQFAISYDMMTCKQGAEKTFINGCSKETSDKPEMKIVAMKERDETPLPMYIKLEDNLGYMKLRQQRSVLRRHKIKEDKNPHEFYYSQLLLFMHWRNEEKDLHRWDLEKCRNLFEKKAN